MKDFVEVKNVCWTDVLSKDDPDAAVQAFEDIFIPLVNKWAPLRKFVVRSTGTP